MNDMSEPPPITFNPITPLVVATDYARRAVAAGAPAFLIDPDRAQSCIDSLQWCAERLEEAVRAAKRTTQVQAPGEDDVSRHFAEQATIMGQQALQATRAYHQQMVDTVASLRAQLVAYRAAEQANTAAQA